MTEDEELELIERLRKITTPSKPVRDRKHGDLGLNEARVPRDRKHYDGWSGPMVQLQLQQQRDLMVMTVMEEVATLRDGVADVVWLSLTWNQFGGLHDEVIAEVVEKSPRTVRRWRNEGIETLAKRRRIKKLADDIMW